MEETKNQCPDPWGLCGARLVTMSGPDGLEVIEDGAVCIVGDTIAFAGPRSDMPGEFADSPLVDLGGSLVMPGLIDCHTHLVYGGSRAREFEMRLNGASYEELARAGGGIASTVRATRAASADDLRQAALARLDNLLAEGVTTVEIKSGYGLDHDTELRMLRVARDLQRFRAVSVRTSFLGAHAVPEGRSADDYLGQVCLPTLRTAAQEGWVDAVDGFCETIGFSPAQIERLFVVARELGLPVKLHAEQLSDQGGATLAAQYGALSADHLEYLSDDGISAMQASGTVAVLLPVAFYFLKETKVPPINALGEAGVPMAIATDSNPGSAPTSSLLLAMNMAATLFGMPPAEVLRGVTVAAARALGLSDRGQLAPGKRADLSLWDVDDPAELVYRIGDAPCVGRIVGGQKC
ncbi:MAG: imidazolonepropionase [Parvularcula sp.]